MLEERSKGRDLWVINNETNFLVAWYRLKIFNVLCIKEVTTRNLSHLDLLSFTRMIDMDFYLLANRVKDREKLVKFGMCANGSFELGDQPATSTVCVLLNRDHPIWRAHRALFQLWCYLNQDGSMKTLLIESHKWGYFEGDAKDAEDERWRMKIGDLFVGDTTWI